MVHVFDLGDSSRYLLDDCMPNITDLFNFYTILTCSGSVRRSNLKCSHPSSKAHGRWFGICGYAL